MRKTTPIMAMSTETLEIADAAETEAAAERCARTLRAGDVLLLSGDLGSGKTTFVRGLARGLGADAAEVTSPSYTLVNIYKGESLRLVHVDLYRLRDMREIAELALEDLLDGETAMAVEWGERLPLLFGRVIRVRFERTGERSRLITIERVDHGSR